MYGVEYLFIYFPFQAKEFYEIFQGRAQEVSEIFVDQYNAVGRRVTEEGGSLFIFKEGALSKERAGDAIAWKAFVQPACILRG